MNSSTEADIIERAVSASRHSTRGVERRLSFSLLNVLTTCVLFTVDQLRDVDANVQTVCTPWDIKTCHFILVPRFLVVFSTSCINGKRNECTIDELQKMYDFTLTVSLHYLTYFIETNKANFHESRLAMLHTYDVTHRLRFMNTK